MPPHVPTRRSPTSSSSSRRSVSVMNLMYWLVSVVSSLYRVRKSTYCGRQRGSAGREHVRGNPPTQLPGTPAVVGPDGGEPACQPPHAHPFSKGLQPSALGEGAARDQPCSRTHGAPQACTQRGPPHLLDDAVRCRLHFGLLGRRGHRLHLCLEAHQLQLIILPGRGVLSMLASIPSKPPGPSGPPGTGLPLPSPTPAPAPPGRPAQSRQGQPAGAP